MFELFDDLRFFFLASNISENSIPPFHIGNFSCVDPEDDDCTYQLRNNRWTDVMEVRGRALYGTSHFDYERESVLDINIETTDSGTPPLSFVGKLLLSVVDCNEVPLDITVSVPYSYNACFISCSGVCINFRLNCNQ